MKAGAAITSAGGAAARLLTRRGAAPRGVVLAYHDVDPGGPGRDRTVGAGLLERPVLLLRKLGMEIVDLGVFVRRLQSGESVERLAALSFDDALLGVHDHALEVLLNNEAPATVFVVSGSLGVDPDWWPGARRTMTADELQRFHSLGLRLAAHTRSHPSLPSLGSSDLGSELAGCRSDLEELTGSPVDLLAYPSGHHDARVRGAARGAGFRAAFTFLNGRVSRGDDVFKLPRLTMGAHMTPRRLAYHLLRSARSWPDHQIECVAPQQP